nr:unnamed protein product [Callosobruchus analis]
MSPHWLLFITMSHTLASVFSRSANFSTSTQKAKSGARIENRITVATRDVAYYLRAYKFNEYDRRYVTDPSKGIREYYKKFPKPPLRSLHWEVAMYCEPSFHECIEYLWKKNHSAQISIVDEECKKMRRIDDVVADPFEGPLERFQWRVTASYYMCMYTMLRTTELRQLHEATCDNPANCLEGCDSRDPSFCPDPCCSNKVLSKPEECWNNPDNPCSRENEPGSHRKCSIALDRNTDFRCPQSGTEWSSLYGICVDIDECAEPEKNNCDRRVEACVRL